MSSVLSPTQVKILSKYLAEKWVANNGHGQPGHPASYRNVGMCLCANVYRVYATATATTTRAICDKWAHMLIYRSSTLSTCSAAYVRQSSAIFALQLMDVNAAADPRGWSHGS